MRSFSISIILWVITLTIGIIADWQIISLLAAYRAFMIVIFTIVAVAGGMLWAAIKVSS